MAVKVETLPIDSIRHPLIDARFDLAPVFPPDDYRGWLDRRTGVTFHLERELKAHEANGHIHGYWYFRLRHPQLAKLWISEGFRSDVSEDRRTLRHHVSRSGLFEWTDALLGERDHVARIFAEWGGRAAVFDYCLKAIRACGCEPVRPSATEDAGQVRILRRFDNIDFIIEA